MRMSAYRISVVMEEPVKTWLDHTDVIVHQTGVVRTAERVSTDGPKSIRKYSWPPKSIRRYSWS